MTALHVFPVHQQSATREKRCRLGRNDQYRPVVFRNGQRVKFEDALNEARCNEPAHPRFLAAGQVRAKQQSAVATATLESSAKADTGQRSLDSLSEDLRTASHKCRMVTKQRLGDFGRLAMPVL